MVLLAAYIHIPLSVRSELITVLSRAVIARHCDGDSRLGLEVQIDEIYICIRVGMMAIDQSSCTSVLSVDEESDTRLRYHDRSWRAQVCGSA